MLGGGGGFCRMVFFLEKIDCVYRYNPNVYYFKPINNSSNEENYTTYNNRNDNFVCTR